MVVVAESMAKFLMERMYVWMVLFWKERTYKLVCSGTILERHVD